MCGGTYPPARRPSSSLSAEDSIRVGTGGLVPPPSSAAVLCAAGANTGADANADADANVDGVAGVGASVGADAEVPSDVDTKRRRGWKLGKGFSAAKERIKGKLERANEKKLDRYKAYYDSGGGYRVSTTLDQFM